MANGEKALGRAMLETLKGVNALIPTATPAELDQLTVRREKLLDEIARLVDRNLDDADARYKAATAKFNAASASIEKALKNMATVAQVITVVGQAIELAAELAP